MITTVWENITPALAAEYLKKNKNRHLQKGYAERLAQQMSDGHWEETHQGIAFNCDGSLRDGQHRLTAIVLSGVTLRMLVARGMKDSAVLVVDTHKGRNDSDAFKLMDIDLTQREISMARTAYFGFGSQGSALDRQTLLDFCKRHQDAINFVTRTITTAWPFPASVFAPAVRAFYTVDKARLTRFLEVLCKGNADGQQDLAAVTFRNFLTTRRKGGVSTGMKSELYRKSESAIRAFLEFRPMTKCYAAMQEEFPLPEETT